MENLSLFDIEKTLVEEAEPVIGARGKPLENPSPYLYHCSPMSGSESEQDAFHGPDSLWNDKPPYQARKKEKPEHRLMVMLKSQGFSNKEIAEKLDVVPLTVGEVLRQPWARERLLDEMMTAGRDGIQEVLRGAALDSVFTLIDIRDDEKVAPSVRSANAERLLDRFLGKPTQRIEALPGGTTRPSDIADVDKEIAALDAETARMRGSAISPPSIPERVTAT